MAQLLLLIDLSMVLSAQDYGKGLNESNIHEFLPHYLGKLFQLYVNFLFVATVPKRIKLAIVY